MSRKSQSGEIGASGERLGKRATLDDLADALEAR